MRVVWGQSYIDRKQKITPIRTLVVIPTGSTIYTKAMRLYKAGGGRALFVDRKSSPCEVQRLSALRPKIGSEDCSAPRKGCYQVTGFWHRGPVSD